MKKTIRAQKDELVDLYAKTEDGKWVLIFKQIPESTAETIWKAGFSTGQNNFSIENETSKRIKELNKKTLKASEYVEEGIDPEEAYENAEFYEVENEAAADLGLYLDMSLVTGVSGTLLIFEDSIQEEDLDDWLGEADKAIAQIDWSDYLEYVATEIIPEDESKWKDLLEDYLESLI